MPRVVTDSGWTYTIATEPDIPAGELMNAIITARLVDEMTGQPPQEDVAIVTSFAGLTPRVAVSGVVGFASIPRRAFTELGTTAYTVPFEISATGFVPIDRIVTIGPQPGFPAIFAGMDLGDVALHRDPVVIRGRVTQASGLDATPLAGAQVTVTGIWRTPPPASVVVPKSPPFMVSVRPFVYFDRTAAAGMLRKRNMLPVTGDSRVLTADAIAGSAMLPVSNRSSIVPGTILLVDTATPDLAEYLTVQSVAGAVAADERALITLTYALRNTHAANATVQIVNPDPPGADNAFQAAVIPGDSCVLLNSMTDLASASVIELHGGPQPAEYHLAGHFDTVTDASGYYRFPGLSRVAQLEITVASGALTPVVQTFSPAYGLVENRLDFRFA
jgi:hypothetical protein